MRSGGRPAERRVWLFCGVSGGFVPTNDNTDRHVKIVARRLRSSPNGHELYF